jgi:hypothetical protein
VTPGQTINITVGAGATGANVNYTKGSNHGSYAGDGGTGFVSIAPINPNVTTFSTNGTFTVPVGITSLTMTTVGGSGGGGGGGSNSVGLIGGTSYKDIRTITVIPGATITISVGFGGQGGRSAISNCGSNAAAWFAIDNDPAQRKGYGGAGYVSGGAGSGYGCPNSFNATGGWSGGGGGSSAFTYSGGTVTAGGGAGGNGGITYNGGGGTGGTAGNATTGNQGATGVAGGAGQTSQYSGYGTDGSTGYVTISW